MAIPGKNEFPIQAADLVDTAISFPPLGPEIRVLMVWPRFPVSFWGFEWLNQIMPEKAQIPPLALATLAALLPPRWQPTIVDLAFDELRDEDILQADLVMISAMHAQRADAFAVLARCRKLGRRTIMGGPYVSREPEVFHSIADHLVVGEVEEKFAEIAADFEAGRARKLYRVEQKPDMTSSPVPRFDLLDMRNYRIMAIQFARGCPFQCEFCDIITIYGRRPRTKAPSQIIAELEALYKLGWRSWIFIVDDNFIGNHHKALEMARELVQWQKRRNYPFAFITEASIDLSERQELLDTMVEANFLAVFIGIETPSAASLRETKKFQNLRKDTLQQVRLIQDRGLWVTAGFIVGFDSDTEDIFERQRAFIESATIPLALVNILHAPVTTALHDRLSREGRLKEVEMAWDGVCNASNFQTVLPPEVLLRGTAGLVRDLYAPDLYLSRALRSVELWVPSPAQRVPRFPLWYGVKAFLTSFWVQGVRSHYRQSYWSYLATAVSRWWREPARLWLAFTALIMGHHFICYSLQLASELEEESGLQAFKGESSAALAANR